MDCILTTQVVWAEQVVLWVLIISFDSDHALGSATCIWQSVFGNITTLNDSNGSIATSSSYEYKEIMRKKSDQYIFAALTPTQDHWGKVTLQKFNRFHFQPLKTAHETLQAEHTA